MAPVDASRTFEPFAVSSLDVGDGHLLYVEEVGSPHGLPVLWLHGGPGTGCTANHRTLFDPSLHRAVLFDQRASGRSVPDAADADVDWASIDMDHHVADIEAVRRLLGIDRWVVTGGSWGSVLGAAYAMRHPDRVLAVVLSAVSLGGRDEIDQLTELGHTYAPDAWREFRDFLPVELRDRRLVAAYRELVMHPDPEVHAPAAYAWCRWEDAHVNVDDEPAIDGFVWDRYREARFRLAFARQVTHCWAADSWLRPGELLEGAAGMGDVPCWLIHGARDRSSTLDGPHALHAAWPGSELVVVDADGHGGTGITAEHRRVLAALATGALPTA
ncbi:MAG: alpha/beta fold hydrolase, partial [Ilumatobacteraceae bacterium]